MKRIVALLLALTLCLTLAACGGGGKSLSGTYRTAPVFGDTYVFREDKGFDAETAYDREYSDPRNYAFRGSEIVLYYEQGEEATFAMKGDYLYSTGYFAAFEGDTATGKPLTLDGSGRSSQQFQTQFIYANGDRYSFALTMSQDGTCVVNFWIIEDQGTGGVVTREEYEGTYAVEGDILTVSYNGSTHTMLIEGDLVYFYVLEKVG